MGYRKDRGGQEYWVFLNFCVPLIVGACANIWKKNFGASEKRLTDLNYEAKKMHREVKLFILCGNEHQTKRSLAASKAPVLLRRHCTRRQKKKSIKLYPSESSDDPNEQDTEYHDYHTGSTGNEYNLHTQSFSRVMGTSLWGPFSKNSPSKATTFCLRAARRVDTIASKVLLQISSSISVTNLTLRIPQWQGRNVS